MNLRLDCYRCTEHPQKTMKDLGITYKYAVAQSVADQWWFFCCENVPDVLPERLTVMDSDVYGLVGWGLNQFMANDIVEYYKNK